MARIFVRLPDTDVVLAETVELGEALLIGRNPNPDRLDRSIFPPSTTQVRIIVVNSSLISENHLLIWAEGHVIVAEDLYSKNGTSVMLPATMRIPFPADSPVIIHLAPPRQPVRESAPKDADWFNDEDYPHAVAREIGLWLERHNLKAETQVCNEITSSQPLLTHPLPLSGGLYVHIVEQVDLNATEQRVELPKHVVDVLWKYVAEQNARLHSQQGHERPVILTSVALRKAHRDVVEAASKGLCIVLQGEPGVGKHLLAECYIEHSIRKGKSLVAVSCGTLGRFGYAQIFGAKKGPYSEGFVRRANGGVLFLKDIEALDLQIQDALIDLLDTGTYKRQGDDMELSVNIGVICACRIDLHTAVEEGSFREGLWHRLAQRVISIPSLRERREDIEAFLKSHFINIGTDSSSVFEALQPEAQELLIHGYKYPNNFQDLESFIRQLPPEIDPSGLGVEFCQDALGTVRKDGLSDNRLKREEHTQSVDTYGLYATALGVYRRMKGVAGPINVMQLDELYENVLKPLYLCGRLGLDQIDTLPIHPSPSYRRMAEMLDLTEDTVRRTLTRYLALKPYLKRGNRE